MGVVSSPSDTTADGGGITLKGASDKTFNWVNATDAWTSSEHIHLLDNKKLFVGGASGTTDGLEVFHDSNNSYIEDTGTGALILKGGDTRLVNASGANIIKAVGNVAELYHTGNKKLETTSGGINVTGAINVNGSALASGNTVDLVADGAIAAGKAVIIKSNGKAAQVSTTPVEINPATNSSTAGTNYGTIQWKNSGVANPVATWGRKNGQMFIAYTDSADSGKLKGALHRPGESSFDVTNTTLINLSLIHI